MAIMEAATAEQIVKDNYNILASASRMESEWGSTFKMSTSTGDNYVLKITPGHVNMSRTELEIAAISHLTLSDIKIEYPRLIRSIEGNLAVETDFGTARLYAWIDGRMWHEVNPHNSELLVSLGTHLAELKSYLNTFDSPSAHFDFDWSPDQVTRIARYIDLLDKADAIHVREVLKASKEMSAKISQLPKSVNHNDANDYNVIVSRDLLSPEVIGFIDFGDLHYGPRVNDLAICLAYAIMGKDDPIGAATHVVRGYHSVAPLLEEELVCLFMLIKSRLVITITMAAIRANEDPDNTYWQVSADGAKRLLSVLCEYPEHLALCRLRHACAMEPCPKSIQLVTWLEDHNGTFFPVTGIDLAAQAVEVFDWSVGSPDLGSFEDMADVKDSTHKLFQHMDAAGVHTGIGRYNEPRAIYTTKEYVIPGNNGPEMRTIHIGMDIFLKEGSPLYAPLDGVVFAIVNDIGNKEYGPLVILQHSPEPDLTFYTLYGHNSLTTLNLMNKGDRVKHGQKIAYIGDFPENGNWVPHSHFQIITDMLDYTEDFPGVALPSQREVWKSLCPDPNLILGISDPRLVPSERPIDEMLKHRQNVLGLNLRLSGDRPLHIVRGWKTNLFTPDGTSFLDTCNNVAHVGHEHHRIVKAGQRQMAVLNTNTRYLYSLRLELADQLLETLPDHLTHIYFVNSGSEANDLALRMARGHIGGNETLVMDQAYHGATASCLEVSPYKFEGPGGFARKDNIHVLPHLREININTNTQAIEFVRSVTQSASAVTFIHEVIQGCAGQIVPPADYFSAIYEVIHKHDGICIADEVQTGLGRVGSAFWSFELYDILPDIVTIGKPLGNGHPIAAVAVSDTIAESFNNGMEFFSSFGGNPVSCAIALEVLRVIQDEKLQSYAAELGTYWMEAVRKLSVSHPVIRDVRGFALFFGIEFSSGNSILPTSTICEYIQMRMTDHHILTSFDGPNNNVLKIKPPMCITYEEVDYFLFALKRTLNESAITTIA